MSSVSHQLPWGEGRLCPRAGAHHERQPRRGMAHLCYLTCQIARRRPSPAPALGHNLGGSSTSSSSGEEQLPDSQHSNLPSPCGLACPCSPRRGQSTEALHQAPALVSCCLQRLKPMGKPCQLLPPVSTRGCKPQCSR